MLWIILGPLASYRRTAVVAVLGRLTRGMRLILLTRRKAYLGCWVVVVRVEWVEIM